MKKLLNIKEVKQTDINSVVLTLTDGSKIDIVTEPADSGEDIFIKLISDRQLKIDFQVRSKP